MKRNRFAVGAAIAASMLALAACSGGSGNGTTTTSPDGDFAGCVNIYAAVSPEKVNLFTDLAKRFADSPAGQELKKQLNAPCIGVVPVSVGSGEATRLLKLGWPTDQTSAARPTVWSPASTMWTADVADRMGDAMVPEPKSFATTPLVYAMPERMARQLGWPDKAISLQDIENVCVDPQGWARFGGAAGTWGAFKLAKTSPHTSTSGLNALLMQAYAAAKDKKGTAKTSGLTVADVANAENFTKSIESCVIHYGDTTGNVLQRIYDRDQNGESLSYISAVAVEETSVINYNLGNPNSKAVKPTDKLVPPREKLVAIYPSGGSLVSDDPLVVLGGPKADWVKDQDRVIGNAFKTYVLSPEAQALLGNYGFRPADTTAKPDGLVTAEYGANPDLPKVVLEQPKVDVTRAATQQWDDVRKPSSVLLVLDISRSMTEDSGANDGKTRLQDAVAAAGATLQHFRSTDELGVWTFSSSNDAEAKLVITSIRDVKPIGSDAESLAGDIAKIGVIGGTPLNDTIDKAYDYMHGRAQSGRINAIVVLTDGEDTTSHVNFDGLISKLKGPAETSDPLQVRIFPIVYGSASPQALKDIAEASGGQVFDATDPKRLSLVFTSVMNNF